ncbi:dehydrogenase [Bacteroidales bacterium OttesenSCG-928-L14]|nr:dehydrogenase [Bacteroidales bacterium OttesenSCG-928-L14]
MIIRSKAPLRLGLAGGGTDVSPYSDIFGGAILNATINMYASASIEPLDNGKIIFEYPDKYYSEIFDSVTELSVDNYFSLQKGVYNRIVKDFVGKPLSFKLTTHVDAPAGSGLGTSSTLVVAIIGAFVEWLSLPLGEYDIARLAYDIERNDIKMAGGKQDQYAATFGGFNFMEFINDNVIINPLHVKNRFIEELSHNLVLYYTETSRLSSTIIESQMQNVKEKNEKSISAMHELKALALKMKESLLRGNIDDIGKILDISWEQKKRMSDKITNEKLDHIYNIAKQAGATGGKVSGAGGGGFMFFYCPSVTRYKVIEALKNCNGGYEQKYEFTNEGLKTWTV